MIECLSAAFVCPVLSAVAFFVSRFVRRTKRHLPDELRGCLGHEMKLGTLYLPLFFPNFAETGTVNSLGDVVLADGRLQR